LTLLSRLEPCPAQVVHGDLCPPNILVDGNGKATALLDWGFYSMAGDNTFDAATAAGFFNMYGQQARVIDDSLLYRLEREFGYSRERMLLYRAVYALTTATAYSADGSDGHFTWCAANLERDDITAVLLGSAVS